MRSFLLTLLCSMSLGFAIHAQNTIELIVYDQQSFSPLSGAQVSVLGTNQSAESDFLGRVLLHNIPNGKLRLEVSAYHHKAEKVSFQVPRAEPYEVYLFFRPTDERELKAHVSGIERDASAESRIYEITEPKDMPWIFNLNPGNLDRSMARSNGVYEQPNGPINGEQRLRVRAMPANHLLIAEDGVPVLGLATKFLLLQHPIFGVSQLELYKGSRSASWGYGANSGVLNIISHKPSRPLEAEAVFQLNNTLGTEAFFRLARKKGPWGTQVILGQSNARANDRESDGMSNQPIVNRSWISPSVYYQPNDEFQVRLGAKLGIEDRMGGDMLVVEDSPDKENNYFENHESQRLGVNFGLKASLDDNAYIAAKAGLGFFGYSLETNSSLIEAVESQQFMEGKLVLEERDWSLATGASLQSLSFTQSHQLAIPEQAFRMQIIGLFTQSDWELSRDFRLNGAVRADNLDEETWLLLPELGLEWNITDELRSKLMLGSGYSNVMQLLPLYQANYLTSNLYGQDGISSLGIERSYSAEIELRFRDKISKQAAIELKQSFYFNRVVNPILAGTATDAQREISFQQLSGTLDVPGFESTLDYTFLSYWNLWVAYSFNAPIYSYSDADIANASVLVPKHQVKSVLYHNLSDQFRINFRLSLVGAQLLQDGSHSQPFVIHGFGIENKFKWARVFLGFDNLGNVNISSYQPVFTGPKSNPSFSDLWLTNTGLSFNAGIKFEIR